MTVARPSLIRRKLRQAQVCFQSAYEMNLVADGLLAEGQRLSDEAQALREGRPGLPRLPSPVARFRSS